MTNRPNLLFLMTDQMQGAVLQPQHPCITPHFDRLAARGVRFTRAYTPNAVCSPARASLMTGLLPHNHGVLVVTHTVDDDQSRLRTELPHWVQRLQQAGYRTGYFGKWHVERTDELHRFGWQQSLIYDTNAYREQAAALGVVPNKSLEYILTGQVPPREGYPDPIFYGVTPTPSEQRSLGIVTQMAEAFLQEALAGDQPWCCFVSTIEPHDPFICGEAAFNLYDPKSLPLPPNLNDDLHDRPGLYRRSAQSWRSLTETQKREAMACYYANITEIDALYGRLIDRLENHGQLDNTIIVLTSDHGELLGAHGLYFKNIGAFEETYHIPMVLSGPGIAADATNDARVGLHDLCPTLLELTGCEAFYSHDSHSFAAVCKNPSVQDNRTGYAEYHGTRFNLTQRILWHANWKYVFNGFDRDELYHLASDPHELVNRIDDPRVETKLRELITHFWTIVRETDDLSILNTGYGPYRVLPYGPQITQDS